MISGVIGNGLLENVHMITDLPTNCNLSAITVTNISKSFTYKMAAKINWHRYGTNDYYVTVTLCINDPICTDFIFITSMGPVTIPILPYRSDASVSQ